MFSPTRFRCWSLTLCARSMHFTWPARLMLSPMFLYQPTFGNSRQHARWGSRRSMCREAPATLDALLRLDFRCFYDLRVTLDVGAKDFRELRRWIGLRLEAAFAEERDELGVLQRFFHFVVEAVDD